VAVHKYKFTDTHLNRWTHVVATYDGKTLTLYVDGIATESAPDPRPQLLKRTPLLVGARDKISGVLVGSVDELAIYDKALPADRVKAHFDIAPPH
jgi:hypothetical protein